MNSKQLTRLTLSAAIAATLMGGSAYAQDAVQDQATSQTTPTTNKQKSSQDKAQNLETIVVTGAATTSGVRKIDASYSITTATAEQIHMINPRSAADLLKISPGVWPESTGGQTGANIEIAGFPGGGDAPFYTNQIMGTPLYGMPSLSFFEQSSMFRLDDTVDHVEILQGGPSVVFGDGQIGLTSNYILRQGSDIPYGSIGVTYGTENLQRLDGFYGFSLGNRWYASVGGFWRTSDGIRDPQFPSDQGGQFTATLSHEWDMGKLVLWARVLDDKNQFITPIPLIQNGPGSFSAYPGFDPLTDTYYSKAMQHVHLESYPGGGTNADLANGRGAQLSFFGGNFDWDFGNGWTLSDKFLIDGGDMDTNALFSGANPQTLSSWMTGNGVPAGSTVSATYTDGSGTVTDPNADVISQGWWYIHKHLRYIVNDFRLSKELFEGNTLTAGLYVAHYSTDDRWSLGNPMLMTNTPNATPIAVSYTQGGQSYAVTDDQGLIFNGGYNITENGTATNKAFYLTDSWRVGQWLLDASARVENEDAKNDVCNLSNVDIDGDPNTLYNNSVAMCNGTIAHISTDKTHTSWTVGATYKLQDNMAVYGRANRGVHFNNFDDLRGSTTGNTPPLLSIQNFEVGYKYQIPQFSADLAYYHRQFDGLVYQPSINGVPQGTKSTYGSDTKGINFIMQYSTPGDLFSVTWVGDWMDGHYSHFKGNVAFFGLPTPGNPSGLFYANINGEQLQRQPKFQFRLTPALRIPMDGDSLRLWVTWEHVGDHTQDQTGLQQLGSYDDFKIGAQYMAGAHWVFTLLGSNVTDELGLTESNSRIAGSAAGSSGIILARPLAGHEYSLQVKYWF